jgi:CheY-like chemotaxis protein/two-component sensor histidine kinase
VDAGASCSGQLEAIREVAMRGSEIVRQLMIYSGKESTSVGVADVSKTVDEMLTLLKVTVTKHAVIETDLSRDLPATRANAAQLRQIVMNLITNASEAIGDRDGVIRVRTSFVAITGESAAISSRMPEGNYVQLIVSDTGCGMSSQTQASVFHPFFTTKAAGRGLGLAVVQGIVRSLGGAIQITTEEQKGTTFEISLPCVETTAAPSGPVSPSVPESAAPLNATVLVVEDEGNLRVPVVRMLRKSGFEVLETGDGTSAIDLIRTQGTTIDAILLDMTLPGAPTHEIVAQAAKVRPDIKVTLTSAYSREAAGDSMTAPQVRSFIRKPFTFADLLKTLRNSLST